VRRKDTGVARQVGDAGERPLLVGGEGARQDGPEQIRSTDRPDEEAAAAEDRPRPIRILA
jgi:hypothetical protein